MNDKPICWLELPADVTPQSPVFDQVRNADGSVDNLYAAMVHAAPAINPADQLYRNLLHHEACPLEPRLRELVATQVAILCGCDYAARNHGENFHDFFGDREASENLLSAIGERNWHEVVDDKRLIAILAFGEKLSLSPQSISVADIETMRSAGISDDEISWIAQISASFAYWARIINALGISLGDEPIGLNRKPQKT